MLPHTNVVWLTFYYLLHKWCNVTLSKIRNTLTVHLSDFVILVILSSPDCNGAKLKSSRSFSTHLILKWAKRKAYNKDKAQGRTRVHTQAAWLNCCRLKVNEVKDCNSMSGYLPQVITSEDLPYFLINIKEINVLNHLSDREKGQINKPRSMCKMWAPFFYKKLWSWGLVVMLPLWSDPSALVKEINFSIPTTSLAIDRHRGNVLEWIMAHIASHWAGLGLYARSQRWLETEGNRWREKLFLSVWEKQDKWIWSFLKPS